jgi:hypothetical protein
MRLSRFAQTGVAVAAVVTGLVTTTAEVSAAAPAAVPAAAAPRPVVSKLSLTSGPVAGGVRVTVTGRYFTKVTRVVFGSSPGKSLTVLSGTKLEVTAPGHAPGTVNVEVVAKAGTSRAVVADRFTYIAAPVIKRVSPARGSTAGGTLVTITGSNFVRVTKVTFGGKRAVIGAPSSAGSLRVTAPVGTAGQVDIRVSTAYGTSAVVTADHYKYVAPPSLTVSTGGTILGYHAFPLYTWVHIAVAGFPPDSAVNYTCAGSGFYQGTAGTTYSTDSAGTTVQTDANGAASFDSAYALAVGPVTCTSGSVSDTATLNPPSSPWPGGTLSISPGGAAPEGCGSSATTPCNYVHFVVTKFPANSIVEYGCSGNESAGPAIGDTTSAGALAVTNASGYASFDSSMAFPSTFFAPPDANGDEVSCGTNGIWVVYDS